MVEYTIAVCNYNMAETVEESLRSMLNQVDKRFEVVVVDDGSTDGSLSILNRLEAEYDALRVIQGQNTNIAEARNQSFEESSGEYILKSLDTDDRYKEGILDFVHIFEELNNQIDREFYLKGNSINIAPKELLLSIPYRSLGWGEDQDLWRQLFAEEKIIWLDHESFASPIGYEYNKLEQTKRTFENRVTDIRGGVSVGSLADHIIENGSVPGAVLHCSLLPAAYIQAQLKGRYEPIPGFERKQDLYDTIEEERMALADIESEYNIRVDRSGLSDFGRVVFVDNS